MAACLASIHSSGLFNVLNNLQGTLQRVESSLELSVHLDVWQSEITSMPEGKVVSQPVSECHPACKHFPKAAWGGDISNAMAHRYTSLLFKITIANNTLRFLRILNRFNYKAVYSHQTLSRSLASHLRKQINHWPFCLLGLP